MKESERERESVCVCVRERESVCVGERESEGVCVLCVCVGGVCERERVGALSPVNHKGLYHC